VHRTCRSTKCPRMARVYLRNGGSAIALDVALVGDIMCFFLFQMFGVLALQDGRRST
jgi:hypothetical protein